MKPSSAILRKLGAWLDGVAGEGGPWAKAAGEWSAKIRPLRRSRVVLPFSLKGPSRKRRKVLRKASKKMTRSEIRAFCVERAAGVCECGCRQPFGPGEGRAEMDHWLNGIGQRTEKESIETCWMLRRGCHFARQRYIPSSRVWNERFRVHCAKWDYPFIPHIEHEPVRQTR